MAYEDHLSRSQEMALHHHHHHHHQFHPHPHLGTTTTTAASTDHPHQQQPQPQHHHHHHHHQNATVLRSSIHSPPDTPTSAAVAAGNPSPPSWLLNSSILRGATSTADVAATSNFLHQLQACNTSSNEDVSLDPAPMNMHKRFKDNTNSGDHNNSNNNNGDAGAAEVLNDDWERDKCKAEILNHPLYDQLLAAHVSCLRIATPVDQLPRIDAQLAQSQHVVAKYSAVLRGHDPQLQALDDKDLDHFMAFFFSLSEFLHQFWP